MKKRDFITPEYIFAKDIKNVRNKLGLTQKEFAQLVNASKSSVERWESSEDKIVGPICLLLKMLDKYPEYMEYIKVPKQTSPIRLWYMHEQTVCTIIDVNDMRKEVRIWNYTDNLMFRAFGIDENPDYQAYQEFLESRCFPASRDKMKLVLKDLDLPFYDPFMIIEKTEGRMAEDHFWIRIERGN